jgi:hypothetical protein
MQSVKSSQNGKAKLTKLDAEKISAEIAEAAKQQEADDERELAELAAYEKKQEEERSKIPPVEASEIAIAEAFKADAETSKNFAERPIGDRIEKLTHLFALMNKLEALRETRSKLQKFVLSSDNSRDMITLQDSTGESFKTGQKHIVQEVTNLIKKRVDEMIAATEAMITV